MAKGRNRIHDEDVLFTLKKDGPLTSSQILMRTSITASYIYKVLNRLLDEKKIIKSGKKYKLSSWKTVAVASSDTSVKSIETPKAVEKSNPTIDALKNELDYIRTTVNQLVQTGEYLKTRIQELST